jgi:UTP--glucose-1-phosphate uridylyltransferase
LAVEVPRVRFRNVKTTSDLLLAQSDLFQLENGALVMNRLRSTPTLPLVKLGEEFQKVKEYL